MPFTQTLYDLFKDELVQLEEEGCIAEDLKNAFNQLQANDADINKKIDKLYKKASKLKPAKDFPYNEPSDLNKIRKKRIRGPRQIKKTISDTELKNRIYGAWLGRCAGCMLGKPLEPLGYDPKMMIEILKSHNSYPINDYIPWFETGLPSHIDLNWWKELKPLHGVISVTPFGMMIRIIQFWDYIIWRNLVRSLLPRMWQRPGYPDYLIIKSIRQNG